MTTLKNRKTPKGVHVRTLSMKEQPGAREMSTPVRDLGSAIRSRFAALGDVQVLIEAREPLKLLK